MPKSAWIEYPYIPATRTRFVQPGKIEIDANERAVIEKFKAAFSFASSSILSLTICHSQMYPFQRRKKYVAICYPCFFYLQCILPVLFFKSRQNLIPGYQERPLYQHSIHFPPADYITFERLFGTYFANNKNQQQKSAIRPEQAQ